VVSHVPGLVMEIEGQIAALSEAQAPKAVLLRT
jgi:hypothetical protein